MSRIRRYGPGNALPPGRSLVKIGRQHQLPQVYLARTGRSGRDVYLSEPDGALHGSRLKWLVSTFLAAGVGAVVIGLVAFSSIDGAGHKGLFDMLEEASTGALDVAAPSAGGPVTFGKGDRLEATSAGLVTKHIVREQVRETVGDRESITFRPFARITATLPAVPEGDLAAIPPFNPLTLYANDRPLGAGAGAADAELPVKIEVADLAGGLLPDEDGQELSDADVAQIVTLAGADADPASPPEMAADAEGDGAQTEPVEAGSGLSAENLSSVRLVKNVREEEDEGSKVEGQETAVEQVKAGDTLSSILREHGVAAWQARAIADAARTVVDTDVLVPGQLVRLTLVPSPTAAGLEASAVSIFNEGQGHIVTVVRNDAGDYAASDTALAGGMLASFKAGDQQSHRVNLYQSLYSTALNQGMTEAMVLTMLRTYAYDTDFKRRVGPGDSFEVFFDLQPSAGSPEGKPGSLLFTSLTVGGETRHFYRFRTRDGVTDFYDEKGNNAKRFLMRKPVRGDARFTSGFGMRMHPLLKVRRMHTGVDWSAPAGTPILAAGSGTVEEAGRKGGNGNFIRIRHANGYQTTYSHLSRFAAGLAPGLKVMQGQTIGFVGSTGLSSGPHLHLEVLINNSYVDPMTIHVPRERQLSGRELAEFEKERTRIDELMSLAPMTMGMVDAAGSGG